MTRPIIGSQYRPPRFEHRTPVEYRALRPEISADAARLQRALCRPATPLIGERADAWVAAGIVGAVIAIIALIVTGNA